MHRVTRAVISAAYVLALAALAPAAPAASAPVKGILDQVSPFEVGAGVARLEVRGDIRQTLELKHAAVWTRGRRATWYWCRGTSDCTRATHLLELDAPAGGQLEGKHRTGHGVSVAIFLGGVGIVFDKRASHGECTVDVLHAQSLDVVGTLACPELRAGGRRISLRGSFSFEARAPGEGPIASATPSPTLASPESTGLAGEHIEHYDVDISIEGSGAIVITETIDYDFDGLDRHGILRDIPVLVPFDADHNRLSRSMSSPWLPRKGRRRSGFSRTRDPSCGSGSEIRTQR